MLQCRVVDGRRRFTSTRSFVVPPHLIFLQESHLTTEERHRTAEGRPFALLVFQLDSQHRIFSTRTGRITRSALQSLAKAPKARS